MLVRVQGRNENAVPKAGTRTPFQKQERERRSKSRNENAVPKAGTRTPSQCTCNFSTIALGQSLDLTVLAEGIETLEHLKMLESYGFDALQGYLESRI